MITKQITIDEVWQILKEKYEVEKIQKYLKDKTEFETAPASTGYHGKNEGGLLDHTLNVITIALKVYKSISEISDHSIELEDVVLVALLHDIGKGYPGYYEENKDYESDSSDRKKKNKYKHGKMVKYPHAHLSAMMASEMDLGLGPYILEPLLIHNGLFTGTGEEVFKRHNHSMLALILHSADMMAIKFE